MQFKTTVFQNETQVVEGVNFNVLTVEQHITACCDKCDFVLTGTKAEIEKSGFLLTNNLTLCDECSF